MKKLIALAALLLLAAGPSPFVWGPWGEPDVTQQPVEQQTEGGATQPDHSLWVVNNTGCAWDADDARYSGATDGTLAAGATAVGSRCIVADWMEHAVYVTVNSKSPNLVLTLSYQPQGYNFTAARRLVDGRYVYEICVRGPKYTEGASPELQPIPNSGYGGVGVPTTFTYSLHNPTSQTIRNVHGRMTLRAEPELACGSGWTMTWSGTWPGPFIQVGTRT